MSGFLPDLASWALRGGSGNDGDGADNNNGQAQQQPSSASSEPPPLTAAELRAQRLARMEEMQRRAHHHQQQDDGQRDRSPAAATAPASAAASATNSASATTPMEIDQVEGEKAADGASPDKGHKKISAAAPDPSGLASPPALNSNISNNKVPSQSIDGKSPANNSSKKRSAISAGASSNPQSKMRRKKELLIRKVLNVTLRGGILATSSSEATDVSSSLIVQLDLGDEGHDSGNAVSLQAVAEILATRLSLDPSSSAGASFRGVTTASSSSATSSLLGYLALSHRRAVEERKALAQSKSSEADELLPLLDEIARQVVSYGATCLREPDLFPQSSDATQQLASLLLHAAIGADPASSITVGAAGPASSFYHKLIDEFVAQDALPELEPVVSNIVDSFVALLLKLETVLDSAVPDAASSGINASVSVTSVSVVSALQGLCAHKRVALLVARDPRFLLPPPDSPRASEQIRPQLPRTGGNLMQLVMSGALGGENFQPYRRRSGPALDKNTILGAAMRIGLPKANPAFGPTTILHQSHDSVERTLTSHRLQLRNHQQAVFNWILALIKGGTEARDQVQAWFIDCLLVNRQADGMRPDTTKVSSRQSLVNVSAVLLKLCEPFVDDETKISLVDPGFVMSDRDHGGVFVLSGPDAVPRLGDNATLEREAGAAGADVYNPKNKFIPFCFFTAARSLRYGLHAILDFYEGVSRQLSWRHSALSSSGRDVRNDPEFAHIFSLHKSLEATALEPEWVSSACRFECYCARVLVHCPDNTLRTMPEDMVDDICEILLKVCSFKPNYLSGMEFRHVFRLMVKLLSPTYASMVRNYNLRAKIGDVLFELFLPPSPGERRETPSNVYTDPMAGGQSFLLSDAAAQETLAPSLLLLYGEVEHTGFYEKNNHRWKIASLIKYLWESSQHRVAFRRITSDKESFIKFANGIMNETNHLITTVMQKLPEIREAQEMMKNAQEWGRMTEERQKEIEERLDDSQRQVKSALPLCNRTIQMLGYLNTDADIRGLFLLKELCPRLVQLLLHVMYRLVGSKGLNLKVDHPEQYEFRPKEMLRDLCAVFSLFAPSDVFAEECARSSCDPNLLRQAIKTCRRLNLLVEGEALAAFEALPSRVEAAALKVSQDEQLYADAPDEFLDELMATFMHDPVKLPSGHYVDRSTITQHLLNDSTDPFNRAPLSLEDVEPAIDLKNRMNEWLETKKKNQLVQSSAMDES